MQKSRRTLLKLSGTALALAALPYRTVRAQAGRMNVVLVLRNEPPTLDPTRQPAIAVGELTLLNVFEGLVRINEDGSLAPCLAESWTRNGNKEYVFKLRKDVKFHDGADFTSRDVQFTFARNADEKSTNKRKRVFTNIESMETPDPHTVVIRLKEPSWLFLSYLSEFTSAIVSEKTADGNATQPVGTGPYRLTSWIKGDSVEMEKFAGHWNAANVAIEKVKVRFISDANAQVNALLSGDVDCIPRFESLDLIDQFKKDDRFTVTVGQSTDVHLLCINNKKAPFDDVRVRRALSHVIDHKSLIEGAINGYGAPIGCQMTALYKPYYVDLAGAYPYDPDKARKLLAEAGHPNGIDTSIKVPSTLIYQRAAEIMQAQFAEAGVRMNIEMMEWAQWLDVVFRKKAYDLSIVTQPDPWTLFNYTVPTYFYQYDSKEFRDLAAKAEAASSEQEFLQNIQAAQRKLTSDAASGWLFSVSQVSVFKRGLQGLWVNSPNKLNEVAAMHWKKA